MTVEVELTIQSYIFIPIKEYMHMLTLLGEQLAPYIMTENIYLLVMENLFSFQ